jgi:hypothetical protein
MDEKNQASSLSRTVSLPALSMPKMKALEVLGRPKMTLSEALLAAQLLVGQWPHARPDDPQMWASALAAALASYPESITRDCIDPRVGLARVRDFPPTAASVVEWCEAPSAIAALPPDVLCRHHDVNLILGGHR